MANALAKFKNAVPAALVPRESANYTNLLVDKIERYGSAAGFGYIKGRYRERATVKGQPLELVAGGGALALALVDELFLKGKFAPHLNRVADAGLSAYINTRMTALGMKHAGRKIFISQPGANPALPAGLQQVDVLGELDAMGGAYLSDSEVNRFANAR